MNTLALLPDAGRVDVWCIAEEIGVRPCTNRDAAAIDIGRRAPGYVASCPVQICSQSTPPLLSPLRLDTTGT